MFHREFPFIFEPDKRGPARVRIHDDEHHPPRMTKKAIPGVVTLDLESRPPRPVSLRIGDPSRKAVDAVVVTAEMLRAIPIGLVVERALQKMAKELEDELAAAARWRSPPDDVLESLNRRAETARKIADNRRSGRKGLGLDHYVEVAEVYLTTPTRKPTVAVAEHFSVSITTANKYIERARHVYGLIPKTTRGKPTRRKTSAERRDKKTTRRKQ